LQCTSDSKKIPRLHFYQKSEPCNRKITISGCYLMLRKPLLVSCCFVVSISFIFVSVFCTWLPQVRKCSGKINFLQGQGRLREFLSESGKIEVFERNQEEWNFKSTFVHFTDMNGGVLVEYFSWKWTICWCWVLKEMNPVGPLLRNLSIHLHCTWLVESINKWVGESCKGGVESIIRTNLWNCYFTDLIREVYISQEKVREFQKPLAVATM